jgi:hypothetical protein
VSTVKQVTYNRKRNHQAQNKKLKYSIATTADKEKTLQKRLNNLIIA